ncbi:alpha/beta-hydrolase [Mytilinidion resinicola]|uniref:Alpha/beta-hydrolase n=1 Tax=Mytilinidion resinicola TaxID=574789 RepID=A0A6A6Z1N8_9PEZI|nr:alpha/beta-hydrolase [Mytilinidion resinicola]KAF2814910.1 alpha/beta-hydrolase [Mytilinidion resinicola]
MLSFLPLSFLIALLAGEGSYAAPLARITGRSVGTDVFSTFQLMEQYAAASYCSPNYDETPNTEVTCPAGNCPLVQAASTDTLVEFENSLKTDVTGFVAVDHTNSITVVSFRGSASIKNWIANLDMTQIPTDICTGCKVHQGFWDSWTEARDGVLNAIKSAAASNPSYKIVVVGHSLGGAISALAAAELRKSGCDVALYTFGSPRVGNGAFSDFVSNQPGGNYRITHYNDIVPRVPTLIQGYVHITPEFYISKPNFKTVAASDIKEYKSNTILGGNNAWVVTDILAHTWYFNSIAQCYINQLLPKRDLDVEVVERF